MRLDDTMNDIETINKLQCDNKASAKKVIPLNLLNKDK